MPERSPRRQSVIARVGAVEVEDDRAPRPLAEGRRRPVEMLVEQPAGAPPVDVRQRLAADHEGARVAGGAAQDVGEVSMPSTGSVSIENPAAGVVAVDLGAVRPGLHQLRGTPPGLAAEHGEEVATAARVRGAAPPCLTRY
jgi:hypothetical protein